MEGSPDETQEVAVFVRAIAVVLAVLLATPVLAAEDETEKAQPKKVKKPELDLRSSPRFAFSPARILFTAELKGGDDVEEYYCPEIEWEWGDGGRSVEEGDCDPWTPDTRIQRRFSATHTFHYAGLYPVRVSLRKSGKLISTKSLSLAIRAGGGDIRGVDPGM